MEEEKKNKMNKWQFIVALLIVIILIFLVIYSYFKQNEIITNLRNQIRQQSETSTSTEKENQGTELDFNSQLVQNIFPFTGAFPQNDLRYIAKIKNMDLENITNDFVLKLAWSKVKKDDWATSQKNNGTSFEINAQVLDNYVKNIFGNISYKKDNFNNTDLVMGNSDLYLYDIIYDSEDDKYYINFKEDNMQNNSFIINLYPKATKYEDRIEITIHPLYIKSFGENQEESTANSYVAYQHYNFETKSFIGRLTDTMDNVFKETENKNNLSEPILNDTISSIKEKELETYTFIYKLNQKTNNYEFYSLINK